MLKKCKNCGEFFEGVQNRTKCDNCSTWKSLYMRQFRATHPEYKSNVNKFQRENRELMNEQQRKWRESVKYPVIYFLINDCEEYIYIGSTQQINNRLANHFKNNKYKSWVEKYNLSKVEYITGSAIIKTKQELEYLESLFIESEKPIKNQNLPNPENIDLCRLREIDNYYFNGDFDTYNYNLDQWKLRMLIGQCEFDSNLFL